MKQFSRSVGVFWRTICAFISRRTVGVTTQIRKFTNFSQNISKAATSSAQSVLSAAQSPTKREDYISVGRLLISKALIIRTLITFAIIGALIYFVAWPFILSRFLTARFFVEDARVETWTGRVIVYSDKKKTVPLYSGRLYSGALRGNGREYDARGVLAYEGGFQEGVRSGKGIYYERGVMVYQGEFEEGTYQGSGVLYDKDGATIYDGQFVKGLYDGAGKLYNGEFLSYEGQFSAGIPEGEGKRYADKVLFYAGGFHEGLPHGQGVSYYPDGTAFYRGGFSAGIFEGNGTEYDESGAIRYTGAFSEGKYNGNGSLYIAPSEHLDAEFQDGEPVGVIRWVRDGHLYYEGEWGADGPSGFGALYDKAGKQIYQGQFLDGTLDGRWLMSLSLEDLRAAMGQADQNSAPGGSRGFLIVNAALGLRVLCSYRTENQEPRILAAYLSAPEDGWTRLLPGASGVTLGRTETEGTEGTEGTAWRQEAVSLSPPPGANLSAGRYDARIADFTDTRAMILYRNGAANAVVWESVGSAGTSANGGASGSAGSGSDASEGGAGSAGASDGSAGTGADASGAAETQMETFLDSLDDMDTGAGVMSVSVRPEYGTDAPAEALAACATAAEAVEMADALLTWWEESERQAALEENLARTDALLSEAQTALSMGAGDESAVAALQERQSALADAVELCKAEKKKAELRVPVGADIASLDAPSMSIFFNPSEADVTRVALTAVAYAQATGKDDTETEANAKTALVNLEEAYSAARAALDQYEESAKSVQSAAQDYSIGTGSKTAWSAALSARSDAKSAAVSALSAFSRQANALNALTGGWVSRAYGWNEEAFGPLFEAEVLPPPTDIPGADEGASMDDGASGGASASSGDSVGGTSTNSGDSASGGGASTDNGASGGGTSTDGGASADNGASDGGASTGSGDSVGGASTSSGDSASGGGASTDNGASGGGASADSGDAGQTIDPDSDEAIYGVTPKTVDSGQTEKINGPRIGEDGKVYPFDPEDEALELQKESGQEEPDPEESVKEAGAALVAVLEALFGISEEEE